MDGAAPNKPAKLFGTENVTKDGKGRHRQAADDEANNCLRHFYPALRPFALLSALRRWFLNIVIPCSTIFIALRGPQTSSVSNSRPRSLLYSTKNAHDLLRHVRTQVLKCLRVLMGVGVAGNRDQPVVPDPVLIFLPGLLGLEPAEQTAPNYATGTTGASMRTSTSSGSPS